jgi:hypothetical protein
VVAEEVMGTPVYLVGDAALSPNVSDCMY